MNDRRILWLDLETTGLDPESDDILEVGALVTDWELTERAPRFRTLVHPVRAGYRGYCTELVTQMHTDNGIFDEIETRGAPSLEAVEMAFGAYITENAVTEAGTPYLGGASVHFDRRFLERMPSVHRLLHHKHIDTSTVKALARAWRPDVPDYQSTEMHRALPDVLESIDTLRYYRGRGVIG